MFLLRLFFLIQRITHSVLLLVFFFQIHMMSDPCTVLINDVCFGLTSTDILFHLGAEEAASL